MHNVFKLQSMHTVSGRILLLGHVYAPDKPKDSRMLQLPITVDPAVLENDPLHILRIAVQGGLQELAQQHMEAGITVEPVLTPSKYQIVLEARPLCTVSTLEDLEDILRSLNECKAHMTWVVEGGMTANITIHTKGTR